MSQPASVGEQVLFTRKGREYIGTVFMLRENSVLVDISEQDSIQLNLENSKTVVAHNNYKKLTKAQLKMFG